MALIILSYIATISVLVSYGFMALREKIKQFNIVNLFASIPLVILGVQVHAYPNAILSGAFGVIGLIGWIRNK